MVREWDWAIHDRQVPELPSEEGHLVSEGEVNY